MGAGIVPIAISNNTIYFLLGQEVFDKKWSDFGGSSNKSESIFETAVREGYEELNGFLGSKQKLKETIKNNYISKISKSDNTYHSYLFKIPYDSLLPQYFNNHHKFIQTNFPEKIDKKGYYEKCNIRWFRYNELEQNKYKYRIHFKEIIKKIKI